jgi:asparagine synthetase B (glutamine-hydrolysing)
MPGIVGIIGLNNSVDGLIADFEKMVDVITYNDDDLVRVVRGRRYLLAVVNIEDGSSAPRYYTNCDESIECMVDGDVFVDMDAVQRIVDEYHLCKSAQRQSLVPFLYQKYRRDFIRYIKGWFNIIIYDKIHKECLLVNSRFGMKPLYYADIKGYFVFSSEFKSLLELSIIAKKVNKKALVEYALFHYPLGKETYLENVYLLEPATCVTMSDSGVVFTNYWDQESLYSGRLLSFGESTTRAGEILQKIVNEMHLDCKTIGVSLTGGFDGRTILAVLNKDPGDAVLYSFGAPGSSDIQIPKSLSSKLHYLYIPIYLDEDYSARYFNDYAKKAILISDGRSSLARAHYPYAFEILQNTFKVVLTGICGSELLRTFSRTGPVISENVKLLYTKPRSEYAQLLTNSISLKYYRKEVVSEVKDAIVETIESIKSIRNARLSLSQRLYVFIIKEVFRKYFGPELSMESPYVYNRFPFLDYEFVDFVFKTPLCGANHDFFEHNPFKRIRGQQLYACIMDRYNAKLADMNTGRMYRPKDLLNNWGRMKVAAAYIHGRFFMQHKDEYCLDRSLGTFISNNKQILDDNEWLNTAAIDEDFRNGLWLSHRIDFFKAVSWAYWVTHYLS